MEGVFRGRDIWTWITAAVVLGMAVLDAWALQAMTRAAARNPRLWDIGVDLFRWTPRGVCDAVLWAAVSGILFGLVLVLWFRRMHDLASRTARPPSASRSWTTWSFFIPGVQLFSPFFILMDFYAAANEGDEMRARRPWYADAAWIVGLLSTVAPMFVPALTPPPGTAQSPTFTPAVPPLTILLVLSLTMVSALLLLLVILDLPPRLEAAIARAASPRTADRVGVVPAPAPAPAPALPVGFGAPAPLPTVATPALVTALLAVAAVQIWQLGRIRFLSGHVSWQLSTADLDARRDTLVETGLWEVGLGALCAFLFITWLRSVYDRACALPFPPDRDWHEIRDVFFTPGLNFYRPYLDLVELRGVAGPSTTAAVWYGLFWGLFVLAQGTTVWVSLIAPPMHTLKAYALHLDLGAMRTASALWLAVTVACVVVVVDLEAHLRAAHRKGRARMPGPIYRPRG